ncbi:hypothetical protein SO802_004258 [Lithocarpus litseifolius]|uniref:Uncharacterized protein n=1 Tax=Lithocarpus litseifolius TaxID=425828 RepID=A0AAW2E4D5_9ROSI
MAFCRFDHRSPISDSPIQRFDYRFLFALDLQSSDDRKSLCEGMFGRSASLNLESTQLLSFHSVRHDRCESQSQRFNFDE